MRKIVTFSLLAFTFVLTSCESCLTCSYSRLSGEEFSEEVCGDGDETNGFRSELQDSAEVHRTKLDCVENY